MGYATAFMKDYGRQRTSHYVAVRYSKGNHASETLEFEAATKKHLELSLVQDEADGGREPKPEVEKGVVSPEKEMQPSSNPDIEVEVTSGSNKIITPKSPEKPMDNLTRKNEQTVRKLKRANIILEAVRVHKVRFIFCT